MMIVNWFNSIKVQCIVQHIKINIRYPEFDSVMWFCHFHLCQLGLWNNHDCFIPAQCFFFRLKQFPFRLKQIANSLPASHTASLLVMGDYLLKWMTLQPKTERLDGYKDRVVVSVGVGGWVFVISLELILWEQMVNGGLPRHLQSQEFTVVCVHVGRDETRKRAREIWWQEGR